MIGWRKIPVLTSTFIFPDWSKFFPLGTAGTPSGRWREKQKEAEHVCFLIVMGEIWQAHCSLASNQDFFWPQGYFEQKEWGVSLVTREWCKWKHYQEATADTPSYRNFFRNPSSGTGGSHKDSMFTTEKSKGQKWIRRDLNRVGEAFSDDLEFIF